MQLCACVSMRCLICDTHLPHNRIADCFPTGEGGVRYCAQHDRGSATAKGDATMGFCISVLSNAPCSRIRCQGGVAAALLVAQHPLSAQSQEWDLATGRRPAIVQSVTEHILNRRVEHNMNETLPMPYQNSRQLRTGHEIRV